MEQELCQYLITEIIQWLLQNFIQQPIVLEEFVINENVYMYKNVTKRVDEEMILHVSSDFRFIYTFSEDMSEIRQHESSKCVVATKIDKHAFPCMRSMQHPQYIGFFKERDTKDQKHLLILIDVTTCKIIHEWKLHFYLHTDNRELCFIWDETLNILMPTRADSIFREYYPTFKEVCTNKNNKDEKNKILYVYRCHSLNFDQDIIEVHATSFIHQAQYAEYYQYEERSCCNKPNGKHYLHHSHVLHLFETNKSYVDHKIDYVCPHIVQHFICSNPLFIEKDFIIVIDSDNHYVILQSGINISTNKNCMCE